MRADSETGSPSVFAPAARMARFHATAPFDIVRHLRAAWIQAGLQRRSMLADREFERTLGAVEKLWLGPWARRV